MRDRGAERAAIEELERALGERLDPRESELPAEGPRTLWVGESAVAWAATEARIRDERAGADALAGHPLAPRVVAIGARAIALEPITLDPIDPIDPLEALAGSGDATRAREIEGTVREHLDALGGPIAVPRALGRIAGRSRADRLLSKRFRIATEIGPVLGGIHPGWLRATPDGRVIALSMRRAQREGWRAVDFAAAEVFGFGSLREVHAAGCAREPAGAAYDLALLAALAREATLGRGAAAEEAAERAREVIERLLPREHAARVRVRVHGPAWLDTSRWDGDVDAAVARATLRELDGLAVGGTTLRVDVEPQVRAGRAAPVWRPRRERRRELFSRWDRGIACDDEGLFSATPEALAERIAAGLRGVVIDGTCGVGAIAIAIARNPEVREVIAVDLDAARLAMARHNAEIYEVETRIRFVQGDVREVIARERADALVLDPPWGGRNYDRSRVRAEDLPLDVRPVIARFPGAIVLKLPRSFDVSTLPPGFEIAAGIDARGVIKMLIARRR